MRFLWIPVISYPISIQFQKGSYAFSIDSYSLEIFIGFLSAEPRAPGAERRASAPGPRRPPEPPPPPPGTE